MSTHEAIGIFRTEVEFFSCFTAELSPFRKWQVQLVATAAAAAAAAE